MPTPVQLCSVQLANECQVQNPSCPFPLLTTRVNRWSHQQQRIRVLYQFSAFVPTVRFVEVQLPQIKSYRTAFILAFCLSEVSQKIVRTYIHQAHFRVVWAFTAAAATTAVRGLRCFWIASPLTLPVVRRLHQSFWSPVPSSVLRVAVIQVAVAQVAQVATSNRCYCFCCPLLQAAQEVAPFAFTAMSLALGLPFLWFCGSLSKTIACSLQSFVTFGGRRQDCFHAGTALFCMTHRLFTTCSCVGTSGAIVCVPNRSKSVRRNDARLPRVVATQVLWSQLYRYHLPMRLVSAHCQASRPARCRSIVRLAIVWLLGPSALHLRCQ